MISTALPSLPCLRRVAQGCLGLLVFALVSGCGGGKGDVTGKVTFEGKPIPWGRITFVSKGGNQLAISSSIKNGEYKIVGCPAGLAKISVESFLARKSETEVKNPLAKGFGPPKTADSPPPEAIGKHLEIPQILGNPESSGLEYTVKRGEQSFDFDLKR